MEKTTELFNQERLEKRMYFFTPYNISDTQKGIQAGHAGMEFLRKYGRYNPAHGCWDFLEMDKTWIILNGGTTNSDKDSIFYGSMNQLADQLEEAGVEYSVFEEPDLNGALSGISFIADERTFDRDKYPDWEEDIDMFIQNGNGNFDAVPLNSLGYSEEEWKANMGKKALFLRELIRNKRLA